MTALIFIVSLPRSGSTLLQRMLSASPEIASSAEPWLMLPLWAMREPTAGSAVYSHYTAATAINDFIEQIPDGEHRFDSAMREFALSLYDASAQGRRYFLDKTPRYYLLIPQLQRLFPDARFVFLLRHPLATLASIAETFNNGRFRWFEYWIDWVEGHRCMADGIRNQRASCRIVHYEGLTADPVATLRGLCDWLDVPFTPEMVSSYTKNELHGRMGDDRGIIQYTGVTGQSVSKWRTFFAGKYRKRVAGAMIRRLDGADLEVLGYPKTELLQAVEELPTQPILDISARVDAVINWVAYHVDYRYVQARYRAAKRGEKYASGFYRKN